MELEESPDKVLTECSFWFGKSLEMAGKIEGQGPEDWEMLISKMCSDEPPGFDIDTFVLQAWGFAVRLSSVLTKHRSEVEQLSMKLVKSQETVIDLQNQLIEVKSDQVKKIEDAVKSSVTSTVEESIKSYSDAVSKASSQDCAAISSPSVLKKTVREVVEQEDRSRNVMIFGLEDSEGEAADQFVTPLLAAIDEKPRIVEVRRFGIFKIGSNRPVQLTVGSSSVASQLIRKGKLLKSSVDFRGVYLGPDRTPAEREERRKLVARRRTEKTNAESDSGVRHLRSGRTVNLPT